MIHGGGQKNTRRTARTLTALTLSAVCFFCAAIWANGPSVGRSAAAPEFEAFQVILDRNIFNPSRRPVDRTGRGATDAADGNEGHDEREALAYSATGEYLSITGALLYDEEAVAFITGSRPEYMAVVRQGDMIAGFRVESIRTNHLVLRNDERTITVPVGFGLSRHGDEPWRLSASNTSGTYAGGSSIQTPEEVDASNNSGDAGSSDVRPAVPSEDVMEKLRQRRQQELDQ